MTDETTNNQSSDGAENTDAGTQTTSPMIPKSRFDEVNKKMRDYEKQLESLTRAQQERDQKEALDRGEHQKIIDELRPQAESAKKLNATLEKIYQAELLSVPEDMRDLIPELEISARIEFIQKLKTRGIFAKPTPPITDAGAQGNPASTVRLTDEEKQYAKMAGMMDEQYAKFKST